MTAITLAKLIVAGARNYHVEQIASQINDMINTLAEGAVKHAPYTHYALTDEATGAFADELCAALAREYAALSQAEREAYERPQTIVMRRDTRLAVLNDLTKHAAHLLALCATRQMCIDTRVSSIEAIEASVLVALRSAFSECATLECQDVDNELLRVLEDVKEHAPE